MGTNYYWNHGGERCPTCGHSDAEQLHIGKSSSGWCFSLHVDPVAGIHDLDDWRSRLGQSGTWITDEYGAALTVDELILIIAERGRPEPCPATAEFLRMNNAQLGPNGLVRHVIDGSHCIGHGAGTWDLITGEFS